MTLDVLQDDSDFLAEILEDYYAECGEHLDAIHENLLALDPAAGQVKVDFRVVDELFRRFHSLKGMSGMVGFEELADIAHHLESYLRLLKREEITLTAAAYDGLLDGVKALEAALNARRQGNVWQDDDLLARLAGLAGAGDDEEDVGESPVIVPKDDAGLGDLPKNVRDLLDSAVAEGNVVWLFEFEPSPELVEKGVNVNFIREQFGDVGQLLHGMPKITEGGGVAFQFLVASSQPEEKLRKWAGRYLSFSQYLPPVTAVSPSTTTPAAPTTDTAPAPKPASEPEKTPLFTPSTTPQTNYVRVDLDRLDNLMQLVGELVIHRSKLEDKLKTLRAELPKQAWRDLEEISQSLERDLRDLREGIMRTRMVPIGETFTRMKFVVRDLVRQSGKQVNLHLSGEETEIDKLVVEQMMDPLLHIVRNAISHGIELPEERQAAGKPPVGSIWLRAKTEGDVVVIQIEDDGRGVNVDRIAQKGLESGLLLPNEPLTPERILDVICTPGLSTKEQADKASGRGVGMDVVRDTVNKLGGAVRLAFRPGKGTTFTIELPLTLAIADALIVVVGGQRFAIPQVAVRKVLEVAETAVTRFEDIEIIRDRDEIIPLIRLNQLFALPKVDDQRQRVLALIIGKDAYSAGLVVDRVLGIREIVVRAITDPLIRVPGISGATELGDGRAILILDGAELIAMRGKKRGRDE
jgi:two-component system chemotaxis sensor kinase CheA